MPEFASLKNLLEEYFPEYLEEDKLEKFRLAFEGYVEWNAQINVVSRKDIENLAERHFLHALSLVKFIQFQPGTSILDAGTGGGFPGIPLAILFPEVSFHLVDSVAKKIKVVQNIVQNTGLKNVQYSVRRVEELEDQYDFVTCRAVTRLDRFIPWVKKRIHCRNKNAWKNGILYLKGGELAEELSDIRKMKLKPTVSPIFEQIPRPFFSSKYLVHIPFCK